MPATYLMQVYTAVRSRNTLALMMHGQSGETGDAAELISRWGPRGRFEGGYNNLSTLAGEMAAIKETHHFYPVLFYFRFSDTFYAPARMLLLALDAAALLRTALDPSELGWLQESAALAELEGDSALLLRTLNQNFPAGADASADNDAARARWRERHGQAVTRLREAGIPTRADREAGAREYVELRAQWEPGIQALAPALGFSMEDVDRGAYRGHARAGAA